MRIQLSAPRKSGHESIHETWEQVRAAAARLLDCEPAEVVERDSPDGGTTYYYASEADAEADQDGAYAVQAQEMPRYLVRPIRDAEMTWDRLGPVEERYHYREDACRAAGQLGQWGGVVIDEEEGTCDWGHAVTPVGEDAPPAAAAFVRN